MRNVSYKDIDSGQIIFHQEEATKSIYFLMEGKLRLTSLSQERIINYYFIQPGESVAEIALFAKFFK